MQLLGIYITHQISDITKNLKQGWYPFGDYSKPRKGKIVKGIDLNRSSDIYQREGLPDVSINCIVGTNGSGKSTLLDIYYRIINNLAYRMLGEKKVKSTGRNLRYARGVYADLYFICENIQYKIVCRDLQTTLYRNIEEDSFSLISVKDSKDPKSILRQLFYTISTNYSLYAFNENEYISGQTIGKEINGEWLSGLFHKNDGYFTPIVITPYRELGNIDVEKENHLAVQRVIALAILSEAQKSSFIKKYKPYRINYELDLNYKERIEFNYQKRIFQSYKSLDIRHVIRVFEELWLSILYDEDYDKNKMDSEISVMHDTAIFYLAYKTVKICFTYDDYKRILGVEKIVNASKNLDTFISYINKKLPIDAKNVIHKILSEIKDNEKDRNHITLKISVCLNYVKSIYRNNPVWNIRGDKTISNLIKNKSIRSYNDAVITLPPAFYNVDITFKNIFKVKRFLKENWLSNKSEFTLNKMSSGERQLLYSLSYFLYHIKNIQSIQEDENRVAYHNICLIFDEIELYFHPDYQRRFIGMLLESLSWCNLDVSKIHSIQILLVTHSPFILTDILTENTLYLQDGDVQNVKIQTFGANYYDILNKSFFFEDKAIGDISSSVFSRLIKDSNNRKVFSKNEISFVGDELIKMYLLRNSK